MKPKIIGLGLGGLIGSRITQLLGGKYEFVSLSRSTGVDITKKETLDVIKTYKDANFVLHFAAKADVDGCEKDKDLGLNGDAWKINVGGTRNVSEICRETGKKMIYVSTDFVFDGQKPEEESYSEEDRPSPINWYAKTKYEGEKAVKGSGADCIIVRIAYPYRAKHDVKKDFVRVIWDKLNDDLEIKAVTDHIFCPTFIDDLAFALDKLIENDEAGIYHVVGSSAISPYGAALKIADIFGLNKDKIRKTTREEFFKDRAPRPYNLNLKNDKIKGLGVRMRGFEEGLVEIKEQLGLLG